MASKPRTILKIPGGKKKKKDNTKKPPYKVTATKISISNILGKRYRHQHAN